MSVPEVKKRKPRGSLSKDLILSAAQGLLREQGIEALSIRKIANALNAGTMSIYSHYATKQDIVSALVAGFVKRAHDTLHDTSVCDEWLFLTFSDIYQATVAEPEYLLLMINSTNIGASSVSVFEDAVKRLVEIGFTSSEANRSFHKVLSFTLGAAMLRNNAAASISSEDEASLGGSSYRVEAHNIMLGEGFDESLRQVIQSIAIGRSA